MNSPENMFLNMMDEMAKKSIPINIMIAKIVSSPKGLVLKFGEEIIPPEQIYCSNYLLPHYHRNYTIKGTVDVYDFDNTTSTEPCNVNGGTPPISKLKGSGKYETHGDLWLEDTLQAGEEVLCVLAGIFWVVVTKITKMPNGAIEGV